MSTARDLPYRLLDTSQNAVSEGYGPNSNLRGLLPRGNQPPTRALSLGPTVRLHFASKDLVHIRLVLLASPSEPVEHVGIDAKAYRLLDRPIKTSNVNVGRLQTSFRRIGIVNLGIGSIGKPL
jgi:hypothetical protein